MHSTVLFPDIIPNPKSYLHSYFIDVSLYQLCKDDLWLVIICIYIHRNNIKMHWAIIRRIDFYTCCAGLFGLSLECEERNEFWHVKSVVQHITTRGHHVEKELLKRREMPISKPAVAKIVVTVLGDVHLLYTRLFSIWFEYEAIKRIPWKPMQITPICFALHK
jgi:hypothetical protein